MRSLALLSMTSLLLLAAGSTCGQLTCVNDAECGTGGVCNLDGICEAAPGNDGEGEGVGEGEGEGEGEEGEGEGEGELVCNTSAFDDTGAVLDAGNAILIVDALDPLGCLADADQPFQLLVEIEGPLDLPAVAADSLVVSVDGATQQTCTSISAFEQLEPTCDGDATCFVLCRLCLLTVPDEIAVQFHDESAQLSNAACVDLASGLVDDDCDALPDVEEEIRGTDPGVRDTDGDGVDDGVELGAVFCIDDTCGCRVDTDPASTTDAFTADTDGDSALDGQEDEDGNGAVDGGETDPNVPDCNDDDDCAVGSVCDEAAAACLLLPGDESLHVGFNGNVDDEAGGHSMTWNAEIFGVDRFGIGNRAANLFAGGDDGLVTTSLQSGVMTGVFTIAVWVQLVDPGLQGSFNGMMGVDGFFSLYASDGNTFEFGPLSGFTPAAGAARTDFTPALDAWHFYVGVLENVTPRIYIDGELEDIGAQAASSTRSNTCFLAIGPKSDGTPCNDTSIDAQNAFPGLVDDVRIFDRALSNDEIRALFLEGGFAP